MLVGDKPIPLWFVSSNQINAQLPASLASSQQVVEVRLNSQRIARTSVTVLPNAPGLFVAVDQAGKVLSRTNPVRRGDVITIYGTGQGAVTEVVADGAASPSSPLARSRENPGVYVNGRLAQVLFSGLTPGLPGLWQINVVVPNDAAVTLDSTLVIIDERYTPKLKAEYPCWCGTRSCRATLLASKRRRSA